MPLSILDLDAYKPLCKGFHVISLLEWSGCLLGLLGAFLLATNTRISKYGWLAFLAANLAMIWLAVLIDRYGLLVQQFGFTSTCLLGLIGRASFRARVFHFV